MSKISTITLAAILALLGSCAAPVYYGNSPERPTNSASFIAAPVALRTPRVAPPIDNRAVASNPRAVLLPMTSGAREQSYLADITYVLKKNGFEPVSASDFRAAPYVLRFEFEGMNPLSVSASVTLMHNGVPVASGYNVQNNSLTDRDGVCRAAITNSLALFERSLAANQNPYSDNYGVFARNRRPMY